MADEPSWDDIFKPKAEAADAVAEPLASSRATPPVSAGPGSVLPQSRRELRASEGRRRVSASTRETSTSTGTARNDRPPRRKRNLLWLKITLPILIVLGGAGGVAAFAWLNYEVQVRELLGWQLPTDYAGTGNGTEAVVAIQSDDIGSDVASALHDAGVTMTFDAFYDLLVSLEEQGEPVIFIPGNYALQEEMSAQSAFDALQNPENKITDRLLITEGTILPNAFEIMAETTGIPLEEFQTAAADLAFFGLPAEAPSLEGYLFPATYDFDGTETAQGILQRMVSEMFARLDSAGVAAADRHRVLTLASIIQREAGSNPDDFYKVSRVFTNRLDDGWNLESDATVGYGADTLDTVFTTDEERADASNPYNTYANPGLPIGPIGLPGDLAIDAALNPVDGPWYFFVTINLATGETVFSETVDEHETAVAVLRQWCNASVENGTYCD
ncbi:MAG: endolytic transglycosylase MltG [Salinibacterium sp.]|nr:endolytic transglycosylase MltG [Salinibacterium sp.]